MSYKIIAKYVKDIEFKIPDPKAFFLLSEELEKYQIKIDIKSNQIKEKIIEVEITLQLIATKDVEQKITSKIIYSTIIELEKILDQKILEKIILIEVPNKVYSNLRSVFVFIFENSGFRDVKINEKVDFESLYNMRKTQ